MRSTTPELYLVVSGVVVDDGALLDAQEVSVCSLLVPSLNL